MVDLVQLAKLLYRRAWYSQRAAEYEYCLIYYAYTAQIRSKVWNIKSHQAETNRQA
jgi:hypothetical protein